MKLSIALVDKPQYIVSESLLYSHFVCTFQN